MTTSNDKTQSHSEKSDQTQIDRFKQTARELGCDETGEAFERAFAKAVPPKRPKQPEASEDRSK